MDKIENKDIRNKTKVTEMHRKIQDPRRRWMECVKEDMAEKKLKMRDAANRPCWRTLTKNFDPT
jgi:hypothetical protein